MKKGILKQIKAPTVISRFKRKTALAKCYFSSEKINNSIILINNRDYTISNEKIKFSLDLFLKSFPQVTKLEKSIKIYTSGGGVSSQQEIIIKSLAKFCLLNNILSKVELLNYNYCILSSDGRYVYSKVPEGPGARAKRQKSYR